MSDPLLGLAMLGLIVVAIMMGYPTAFTLMGLGAVFGFVAFWDPSHHWWSNRVFDLMRERFDTRGRQRNEIVDAVDVQCRRERPFHGREV